MVLRYAAFLLLLVTGIGDAGWVHGQDLKNLTGISSLTGTCERIIMAGHDFSRGCAGKILQSTYSTGRTGFYVMLGENGATATFSGIQGAKPDPDSQLQSVDKIIFNLGIEGVAPTSKDATGSCAYSNPYNGPMTISCSAVDTDGGAYLLQFRTDGSEPEFSDLSETSSPSDPDSKRDFSVGAWVGGPLKDDPDGGCLMSREVNRDVTLMVYANGNEAFELNLFNDNWSFTQGQKLDGDLLFDGTTFPLSGVEARNDKVLTLKGGAEEDGYASLFTDSSELIFRMGREQVRVDLTGSSAATERLIDCVSR